MARQVRAARHYRAAVTPLRQIADGSRPKIARDLKAALQRLPDLIPASADDYARTADWTGLKAAIDFNHFRETLKAAFASIGKAREAAAQHGVQQINGRFAQAGRKVRYRKYSPDQPRDERGRWVAEGGGSQPGGVRAQRAFDKGTSPVFSIIGRLTRDMLRGISSWKGTYGWVNNYLRGIDKETPEFIKERVANLRAAIGKASTTKDGVVYRGVGGSYKFGNAVGDKISMKGIIATTTDEDYAKVGKRWIDSKGTLFRIYLPKGSNALNYGQSQEIRHGGTYDEYEDDEREVILDHESKFYVRSVSTKGRLTTVDLVYRRGRRR